MNGTDWLAYVKRTFIRTDKDTEIFEATTDVLQMLVNSYPFEDYKSIKTDASISSANSFAVATDFMRLLSEITCLDDDSGWTLNHLSAAQFERKYGNYYADATNDGIPKDFCILANNVYVGPAPDKSTYTYRYVYEFYQEDAITAATTTVPFTTVNRKMLKHFTLGALYQELENQQLADYHNSMGVSMLSDIVGVEKNNVDGVTAIEYQDI